METERIACAPLTVVQFQPRETTELTRLLPSAEQVDPIEESACYGRWWFDMRTSSLLLSRHAAHLMDTEILLHSPFEKCAARMVPEDTAVFLNSLSNAASLNCIDFHFRAIHDSRGMRWLRMRSLPSATSDSALRTGILVDVTSTRIAALRERFSYEVTQSLVGQDNLDEAVSKVLQLVCENLGWEWGAYWSPDPQGKPNTLVCTHYWNFADASLDLFTRESGALRFAPGEGFVGRVWSTGAATWVEDTQFDPRFLRRKGMRKSGLQSGYIFPVSYVAEDGERHRVGVLEFFSRYPRQCEAQLPNLSAAIGSLIAQTVLRMAQQERIRRLAQTDDLTGLANRAHFHSLLNQACAAASRHDHRFALFYIDLDRFKPINDEFGHEAGNAVLRDFAKRLQALLPETCQVGRLGGDEFAILAPVGEGGQMADCDALAEKISRAAALPFEFEGHALSVSASVGIAVNGCDGASSQELLRRADAAMYRKKRNSRPALLTRLANREMRAQARSQLASQLEAQFVPLSRESHALQMEAALRKALDQDEFFLEYQPIFDNFSRQLVAVEALIRWRQADGRIVPPDMFIPIAEKSSLIMQIGRWVFTRACRDLDLFRQAGHENLKVSLNMAAIEFTNPHLPAELQAILDANGIQARQICLELTEGTVMKNPEKVIPVMHELRRLGVSISLDDFGMGHSSLSRIKTLPITSIKIDRTFIKGLPNDRGDGAIVRTILDLGRHMGLAVLAEGVETDAQLAYLTQFGCPLIQGYLLGAPRSLQRLFVAAPGSQHATCDSDSDIVQSRSAAQEVRKENTWRVSFPLAPALHQVPESEPADSLPAAPSCCPEFPG